MAVLFVLNIVFLIQIQLCMTAGECQLQYAHIINKHTSV